MGQPLNNMINNRMRPGFLKKFICITPKIFLLVNHKPFCETLHKYFFNSSKLFNASRLPIS